MILTKNLDNSTFKDQKMGQNYVALGLGLSVAKIAGFRMGILTLNFVS